MTHPFPLLEPSLTPSRMPKPNVRKTSFSKQKVFVLENLIPSFSKYIRLSSEANCWIIFPKQSWVSLRDELLDHSLRQFFGKSSLEIHFTTIFHFSFLSCHAFTPNFSRLPRCIWNALCHFQTIHANISQSCIYYQFHILITFYLIHINNVEYIKGRCLYWILIPLAHIFLSFCVRIGSFDRSCVFVRVQVFRVSCTLFIGVRVQRMSVDHCG